MDDILRNSIYHAATEEGQPSKVADQIIAFLSSVADSSKSMTNVEDLDPFLEILYKGMSPTNGTGRGESE